MAEGSKDQSPGEFGRGVGRTRPARRDHNAPLRAGRQIDVADVSSRLADQLQARHLLDDSTRQGRTLLDEHDGLRIA